MLTVFGMVLSRLWKLNMIEMLKMCVYAAGPVLYTIHATDPKQLEINREHLRKWYGIDHRVEPSTVSEHDIQNMMKKKSEELKLKKEKANMSSDN